MKPFIYDASSENSGSEDNELAPGWQALMDYLPRMTAMTAPQAYDFVHGIVFGRGGEAPELREPDDPKEVGAMIAFLTGERTDPHMRGAALRGLLDHLRQD